ncbi:undecaprenyl-diphosphate phosphatase [Frankia sp. AiPa1]|uniref:undecaprenyl-diphosphate phosphatase n=1 Tax=Frankia sp. AiPa1 TaxID=573492 RepID=UPI00202AF997|nr:undecaprenyl-diphosphate phosphatase [Frankia sp. AiPa1]MCL9761463.1 undecaprenyl-diphosphate phosphatase [Frankia sp. AiPa1]
MNYPQAAVLGLVQGLTEFLPVSSSAHLRIVAAMAGWDDPGAAFSAVTQIGTEATVLLYFRRDIARIARAWGRSVRERRIRADPDARIGWLVLVGTVPIGVCGLTLKDAIEGPFRDLRLTAASLVGFGLVLGAADRSAGGGRGSSLAASPARRRRTLTDLTVRDGVLYGFAQTAALIPGVSRSGATISGGLLLGYTRLAAARYSFLLALPAVLASGLLELRHLAQRDVPVVRDVTGVPGDGTGAPDGTAEDGDADHGCGVEPSSGARLPWGPTLLATGVAFATGYASIAWFLPYVSTRSFAPFVAYRVGLGALVLLSLAAGALETEAGALRG